MRLEVTTPPFAEPITLAEAKSHLRVTGSQDDGYISGLIVLARLRIEQLTGFTPVNTIYEVTLDALADEIKLPRAPVGAISCVKLYDQADAETTVSSSVYRLRGDRNQTSAVVLKDDQSWPDVTLRSSGGVVVCFIAGTGISASNVPETIKHACKMLVGHYFENREPLVTGTIVSRVPDTVEALLSSYRSSLV